MEVHCKLCIKIQKEMYNLLQKLIMWHVTTNKKNYTPEFFVEICTSIENGEN